jgi:hypothetical protein
MPRRARVRSPRGAGVRPRRAALSTPASPRSNAVVVDGAPARRYCVIRRARPEPPRNGQRARDSAMAQIWFIPPFADFGHCIISQKSHFFALTFSRLRCTAASSVSATPPSNRLFSSSAQKTFQIRRKKVNDARPLPRRHSDPRSRATLTRLDLSRRRRALGQSAPPLFFSSQGRLASQSSRSPRSRQAPPIAPIGLFVFPLQRRVRRS